MTYSVSLRSASRLCLLASEELPTAAREEFQDVSSINLGNTRSSHSTLGLEMNDTIDAMTAVQYSTAKVKTRFALIYEEVV